MNGGIGKGVESERIKESHNKKIPHKGETKGRIKRYRQDSRDAIKLEDKLQFPSLLFTCSMEFLVVH